MKKKLFRLTTFFLFFFFYIIACKVVGENAAKKLGEIKLQQKEIETQLKFTQKNLSQLLYKIGKNKVEKEKLQKEIAELEFRIENKKEEILKLNNEISVLKLEVGNLEKNLSKSLVSFYKFNSSNFLNDLLSTTRQSEFLRKYKYFSLIVKALKKEIIMARKKFFDYQQKVKNLYREQKKLTNIIKEKEKKVQKYKQIEENYEKLVVVLKNRKKEYQRLLQNLREEEEKIKTIIRKKKKEEQEKRKKLLAEQKNRKIEKKQSESQVSAKKVASSSEQRKKFSSKMIWPLGDISRVVAKFGKVKDIEGLERNNTGIDILSNKEEAVKAVLDGTVIYRGYMNGYGNIVIIDHGNDLVTVYANFSSIEVGINEKLKQGDIIGRSKKGENFHFEVRVDSDPQDPLKWLM